MVPLPEEDGKGLIKQSFIIIDDEIVQLETCALLSLCCSLQCETVSVFSVWPSATVGIYSKHCKAGLTYD